MGLIRKRRAFFPFNIFDCLSPYHFVIKLAKLERKTYAACR